MLWHKHLFPTVVFLTTSFIFMLHLQQTNLAECVTVRSFDLLKLPLPIRSHVVWTGKWPFQEWCACFLVTQTSLFADGKSESGFGRWSRNTCWVETSPLFPLPCLIKPIHSSLVSIKWPFISRGELIYCWYSWAAPSFTEEPPVLEWPTCRKCN